MSGAANIKSGSGGLADNFMMRPRALSEARPTRRQRRISQTNRRSSQAMALTRRRRESRHGVPSLCIPSSRDQDLHVVKELGADKECQGYFDKV